MHIPDAVIDPRMAAATGAIAAGGLAFAARRLRGRLGDRTTVLMGSMAAFVFAAQMVNFPLYPFPASGHLLGGVLAAVLLGPWAGAAVIGAVLLVQCFLFGDGGLTALGANFVNMGLIGSVVGYAIYEPIRRGIGGRRGILLGSMIAAWFSVILASGAFAVELAATGRGWAFLDVLGWMTLVHSAIGLGEALITGMVVRFLLLTRPDLIETEGKADDSAPVRWGRLALAGLGISLAVAIFLGPMASERPDGLEFVGERKVGFLPPKEPGVAIPSPIPDYEMPGFRGTSRRRRRRQGLWGRWSSSGSAWRWPGPSPSGSRNPRASGKGPGSMRLDGLERPGEGGDGPLHRLGARLKLLSTLAFVVGVVLTPPGAWRVLAAEGLILALAIGLSGVPPLDLIRRWLGFLTLVVFLAAMVAPGHPDRARLGWSRWPRRSWPRTAWPSWR